MAVTHLSGLSVGPPVNVTASTLTVNQRDHAGKMITLNRAAGVAVTLPAATGTGSSYEFYVGTTISSNSTTISSLSGDVMQGTATLLLDGGDTVSGFSANGNNTNRITMDGSTTGGLVGAYVRLVDVAVDTWFVFMISNASGVEATPFSNV